MTALRSPASACGGAGHLNCRLGAIPGAWDETEEVISDARGTLTPAETVERKLAGLLNGRGQRISHFILCRLSSRDRGLSPTPTSQ